ncbi:MAG: HAMP domain-containing histidine kinase, partial [Clostridiales bacterium]|nr:HAMP domain-containing histidine kinase [Clostridiales bacterium]
TSEELVWNIIWDSLEPPIIGVGDHLKIGDYETFEVYHKFMEKDYEVRIGNLEGFGYLIKLIDITDKKLAEIALQESERKANELVAELRKANELKNNFISTLAHELRNPIATMSMGISLLDKIDPGSKADINTRKIIKRQTAQLIRLVDDILNTSRIITKKMNLIKEDIEVNSTVEEIVEEYKVLFDKKEIELEGKYHGDPIYAYADPTRIKQAIGNLLTNSLKFTDKGGEVKVIVSRAEKSRNIIIVVVDTGIGIAPELLPELFKPFVQTNNSLIRDTSGLGLGLAIVKGIVNLHNGTLEISSDGVGKGTKVILEFPG